MTRDSSSNIQDTEEDLDDIDDDDDDNHDDEYYRLHLTHHLYYFNYLTATYSCFGFNICLQLEKYLFIFGKIF